MVVAPVPTPQARHTRRAIRFGIRTSMNLEMVWMLRFDRFHGSIGVGRGFLNIDDPRSFALESSRPRNPLRLALLNKVQLAVEVPALYRSSPADSVVFPAPPSV